jgi:hypothetical protein
MKAGYISGLLVEKLTSAFLSVVYAKAELRTTKANYLFLHNITIEILGENNNNKLKI